MRDIMMKICLIGLVLVVVKATALAQDQDIDIRCEIIVLNLNLPQDDPGYFINFGSFSFFTEGEKSKVRKSAAGITKYYKLPQTNLTLSVLVGYAPTDESSSVPQLMMMIVLGKRKVPVFSKPAELDRFFNERMKYAVSYVRVVYPMKAFDEVGEGVTAMSYLEKKEPIQIMMKCKKIKKAGK